ncbi:hypothetical protein ACQ86N_30450 [Puia sp. P3]|uniref:hypothetical protein n=1 Tax=Puia sp. P3 TaxID=3423952 RepID=UPI003D66B339
MSKAVGVGRLGVRGGGKDLGNIGAEAGFGMRGLLLVTLFGGSQEGDDGRVEGGGGVLRTQVLAGYGNAGLVIDEDLVVRIAAIGRRADDLDAVAL